MSNPEKSERPFEEDYEIIRNEIDEKALSALPFGMYAVTRPGRFVYINKKLVEYLKLPKGTENRDLFEKPLNIEKYYKHKEDRDRNIKRAIKKLEDSNSALSECFKDEICFINEDKNELWVILSCKAVLLHNDELSIDERVIGFTGCVIDIDKMKKSQLLIEHVPVGMYKLDKDDRIVDINSEGIKILGYDSKEKLIGSDVKRFFYNPKDLAFINGRIKEGVEFIEKTVEIIKKDKEIIFVSLRSKFIRDSNCNYLGREGVIIDVSDKERYDRITKSMTIGYYSIRDVDGNDIIKDCNKAFAEIFGYRGEFDLKEKNVLILYNNAKERDNLYDKINEKDKKGLPLIGYTVKLKRKDGETRMIEISSSFIKDNEGKILGRAGVVRDITEEYPLKRIRNDMGGLIHSVASTLIFINSRLEIALPALGSDPFKDRHKERRDIIKKEIESETVKLNYELNKFIENNEEIFKLERNANFLKNKKDSLDRYQKKYDSELWGNILLNSARTITEWLFRYKEALKYVNEDSLMQEAIEAERICCLASVYECMDHVELMEFQLEYFRRHVQSLVQPPSEKENVSLTALLKTAVEQLVGFARRRNIRIIQNYCYYTIEVSVEKTRMIRALFHVIHNAIKYSWMIGKKIDRKIYIKTEIENNLAIIIIVNEGVKITKEEIEQGLIFEFGYRGNESGDLGRVGTGIGLSDAKEIIESHGGTIELKSESIWSDGSGKDSIKSPNKTTVIINLPAILKEEEQS